MKKRAYKLKTLLLLGPVASFVACIAFLQVISNSWHVYASSRFLRSYAFNHLLTPSEAVIQRVEEKLLDRANLYISEIRRHHLEDGMVINRGIRGSIKGSCDSLLFSSILYASLTKLQQNGLAAELWESIRKSQVENGFIRHPNCSDKATSRDQILGLLVAVSQRPEGYEKILDQLFKQLSAGNGYFSHGSTFVSFMTPGLADIVRRIARIDDIAYNTMPDSIRRSFSTLEISVPFVKRGYRTHLSALQIWLELELEERHPFLPPARSVIHQASPIFDIATPESLASQRLDYLTQTLVERQPQNLFYRYLRYRAARALSPAVKVRMMSELLAMRQFPKDRLPADCDRRADYLWQRVRENYRAKSNECNVIFSGVDFLWMAALLTESHNPPRTAAIID